MEHRWGERNALNLTVLISPQGGDQASGTLRDASISGAYLQTTAGIPLLSPVHLYARIGGRTLHIWGWLVRRDDHGYGVEWDPECRAVRTLLGQTRAARPEVALGQPARRTESRLSG